MIVVVGLPMTISRLLTNAASSFATACFVLLTVVSRFFVLKFRFLVVFEKLPIWVSVFSDFSVSIRFFSSLPVLQSFKYDFPALWDARVAIVGYRQWRVPCSKDLITNNPVAGSKISCCSVWICDLGREIGTCIPKVSLVSPKSLLFVSLLSPFY